MADQDNQDIDLRVLYRKTRGYFKKLAVLLFRAMAFLTRNYLVLVGLLVVGLVLGYLLQTVTSNKREAEIIVHANVESITYLYDAVNLLELKIKERDTVFLNDLGISIKGRNKLKSIDISPIINIRDILEKYRSYSDNQSVLLLENVESKESFFESKNFLWDYELHTIKLKLSNEATDDVIDSILSFLENNSYLQSRREVFRENLNNQLAENTFSLKQLDSLLVNSNKALISNKGEASQVTINGGEGIELGNILQAKTNLLDANSQIEQELLMLDKLVHVINKPVIVEHKTVMDHEMIWLPILFIFLFMLLHLIKKFYFKLKKIAESSASMH
tara:strand:+ start:100493 stop:101488 length:996 start_codon:yes stop_codon:yes gene_type:complete